MLFGPKEIYFYKPNSAYRNSSLHSHPTCYFPCAKIPAHSCHQCWLIPSTVSLLRGFALRHVHLRKPSFGHMIMGYLDNGTWGGITGSTYQERGGRFRLLCRHISLLVPASSWPPSGRIWAAQGEGRENTQGRKGEKPEPQERCSGFVEEGDVWRFSGCIFLEAGLTGQIRGYMESHRDRVAPSVHPESRKCLFGWQAANMAEAVLGWEPSAGNDIQTERNNFVFTAIILPWLFMAVITGFPFMVVS